MERDPRGWHVSPAPDGRGKPEEPKEPSRRTPRPPGGVGWRFVGFVVALLALNFVLSTTVFGPKQNPQVTVPYSPYFLSQVDKNNVKDISAQGEQVQGHFKAKVDYKGTKTDRFKTQVPTFANTVELDKALRGHNVTINAEPENAGRSIIATILLGFGPTILLLLLFFWIARRAAGAGAGGPLGAFGRTRAKRVEPTTQRVTFDDVAGIDEAKDELEEIVDFLKNPDRYTRLGGRVPRGVLLSGAPGTGKTLLARAVAGEAHVPFFSAAASEFVEAIVGVGASRVRDLFEQARKDQPAIIFIDELDAIGRSRSGGLAFSGSNDEREQTLNQILTEMDGFDARDAVIVLAATNRPEVLDTALLRPGRFDRRIAIQPPDADGRKKILEVHTRSIPLDDDVDLDSLAATTVGMVGADLANLANEAALTAARHGHDEVHQHDFTAAMERVVLGAPRKLIMSLEDRRRTAYHEGGHAIVGMLTPGADPVRKVSIIPRGVALGVTLSAPTNDKFSYDEEYLRGKIKVALGGRVAEEIVFGEITTGAESDIQQLTEIARRMVGRWGMSEAIGPISVLPSEPQGPLLPGVSETSETTQELIDKEVRRIVDEAHHDVTLLLDGHRENLDALAAALLEHETLDEADAYREAGIARHATAEHGGPPLQLTASDDAPSGAPAPTARAIPLGPDGKPRV
jgi:cell division protease FtsH